MNKLHFIWLAPSALMLANFVTISRALRSAAGQPQIVPPGPIILTVVYLGLLWWLTPLDKEVYKSAGLPAADIQSTQQLESSNMTLPVVVIGLLLIVGILVFLWFMGTPRAMHWVHRQTVQTVLRVIEAKRKDEPQESLVTIYESVARWRGNRVPGVENEQYLQMLADAGCFDTDPSMSPEEFAETLARVEDFLKLKKTGSRQSHRHSRHSRASGNPESLKNLDSHFHGNDHHSNFDGMRNWHGVSMPYSKLCRDPVEEKRCLDILSC